MLNLLTDQALGEGTEASNDGLGFRTYARVLADAAAGTPGPFTIGVFGEWGTGKSSLMRLIESELNQRDGILTVWFNAWRYEKEEHPIVPLVGTIVRELEKNQSFLDRLSEGGRHLINSLRAVAYGFSARSKVKIPGLAEIEASFVAKEMIDRASQLTRDPLLDRSLYYDAFESLSGLRFPDKNKIVVIIDDLDRCFPDLAIKLLESIKLVLSQQGFVFVLGVARRVIEGYLSHRYEKEYGIEDFHGNSYLDKIVQLPFHIPPHASRMEEFSTKLLSRIDEHTRASLQDILPVVGAASGGNPRTTIRFVNNLLIDLGISRHLVELKLIEPISVEYFAVSRCLQQRWPDAFSYLVESDSLCDSVAQWDRDAMQREISEGNPESSAMAKILTADKDLYRFLTNSLGASWLKDHDVRKATVEFLRNQRYEFGSQRLNGKKPYDIFLIHDEEDMLEVTEIARRLHDSGVKTYIDDMFSPEDYTKVELTSAAHMSRAIGVCIGPQTSTMEIWGRRVRDLKMHSRTLEISPLIIPIYLAGSDPESVGLSHRHYRAVNFSEGIQDGELARLVNGLQH